MNEFPSEHIVILLKARLDSEKSDSLSEELMRWYWSGLDVAS